jgi:nucleoside-diphosphate-sugar epimerase
MLTKRIVFTGGSGVAGQHAVNYLLSKGHQVLNLDLAPSSNPTVHTIKVDLTQSGQVFNGISSHFRLTQPFRESLNQAPDAVVHFAGFPRNMLVSDDETFRVNALSAYNVIEAACKLGVRKIIIASSVTVYGVTYAEGDVDYPSFPVDESIDTNPMDTYAISKLCCETIARGFARKYGVDIYVFRIGAVIEPQDYEQAFRGYFNNPEEWKVHGWSYTDARDLGQMCDLGIAKDGLGFQIFNATNDEITHPLPTKQLLEKMCKNTPFTREMGIREAPLTNRKIKELLGFEEEHNWHKYVSAP